MASNIDKAIKRMELVSADMETDVREFEGKPLTGKTVGELHGTLAAAIQAIAETVKEHLQECKTDV